MNRIKFSKYDFRNHIEKNKAIYIMLFLCFFIGFVFAIIIALSKTSYLGLLNIEDKTIISTINGTISIVELFWKNFWSFLLPLLLIFLFSLNYYLGYASFVVFAYQSMLLILTTLAMIESYGFLGFLKIFLILPINISYFFIMAYWIVSCFGRAKVAKRAKMFSAGFDNLFLIKFYACFACVIILSLVVGLIVPLILKTAIFIVF